MVTDAQTGDVSIIGDDWTLDITVIDGFGSMAPSATGTPVIKLIEDGFTEVGGTGFKPGTRADVFMFSDPVLLGSFTVAADGTFAGRVQLDKELIPVGEHTLQVQGIGTDGYVRAANVGVSVEARTQDDLLAPETPVEANSTGWIGWVVIVLGIGLLGSIFFLIAKKRRDDEEEEVDGVSAP